MKVSEIGQFGLIDLIAKMVEKARDDQADSWKDLIVGVGDDCAVWKGNTANQLAKVDCQVEGIHFNLDITSWEDLGWKSLAVNISDIASMGGLPRYALVSLGLPPDTEVENVLSLYKGLLDLAKSTGTAVVGGNISGSPHIFIDVNLIGVTGNPQGKFLSRSAAQTGDLIAVTGWLGTSAAGLEMLQKHLLFDRRVTSCLKKAFTRPEPRLKEGLFLVKSGIRTGMDISDGLLADLGHICDASKVGAEVYLDKLPIRPEVKRSFPEDRVFEMALSGGEDYQLLFTAKKSIIDKVIKYSEYPVTVIGEIVSQNAGQVFIIDEKGGRSQPRKRGWDHFSHK